MPPPPPPPPPCNGCPVVGVFVLPYGDGGNGGMRRISFGNGLKSDLFIFFSS